MNKRLVFTLLLLVTSSIKTLVSVSLALCFLAVDERGPPTFLLPYAEGILLFFVVSSFFFGHKPSEFKLALKQEKERQADGVQPTSLEKDVEEEEYHVRINQEERFTLST